MSVLKEVLAIYEREISIRRGYAKRWTKPPFEKVSGVDHTSISNWRRGKCGANLASVEAVANALGYRLVLEKIE